MVRAPRRVGTDCTTCAAPVALVLTTVRTPSPQEANARRLPGSNPAASTPPPIGALPSTLPDAASITAMTLLSHTGNSCPPAASSASPEGSWQPLMGHTEMTLSFRGSITARLLRSEEHTSELQSPCNLVCRLLL